MADGWISFLGDKRETVNVLSIRAFPMLIQSGNGEDLNVLDLDSVRKFPFSCFLPFIVSVKWNDTSTPGKRLAKGRFFINSFNAGIDQLRSDLDVFSPEWN